jgi:hypothetical protein
MTGDFPERNTTERPVMKMADPSKSEAQWRRSEERFWKGSGAAQSVSRNTFLWILLAFVFVIVRVFLGSASFQ